MPNSLVVTGPSGSGKTTVIESLLKVPLFELSISYTTRERRPGEVHGKHYFFVSREEFQLKIAEDFFLEHTEFSGNLYGTPKRPLDDGKIVIFDIELEGLRFFKERSPRAFFCLVYVDKRTMEKRLMKRLYMDTDEEVDEEDFKRRMASYEAYEGIENEFEFNKVINNSGSVESVMELAHELADEVIEYYEMVR